MKPLEFRTIRKSLAFSAVALLLSACSLLPETTRHIESNQQLVNVTLFGINDFHGQIPDEPEQGGMVALAHHLLAAKSNTEHTSFLLHAGDHVGASPAESALLQDEPAIEFLNIMQRYCLNREKAPCEVIGVVGNHEFDEGSDEMLRLLNGGKHENGPFLQQHWQGANYTTLGANIKDKQSGELLLPAFAIREVDGIPIGFIGVTLDITPMMVVPGMVDNLIFENQAEIVTQYTDLLKEQGVHSIVVIVHDGSRDTPYEGQTSQQAGIIIDSRFGRFIEALPDEVDVLVTGHSHRFTNAYVQNKTGKRFLVTQAFSSGRAYSHISLQLDPTTKDIVKASAEIIMTSTPHNSMLKSAESDALDAVRTLQNQATQFAKDVTNKKIGTYLPTADEIALGVFIANTHQAALKTDIAVMNRGGVRASLKEGKVTWGDIFAIQPFSNPLIIREYTGEQLIKLINQNQRIHWSQSVDIYDGHIIINNAPVRLEKRYTLGGNAYLMNGEDFAVGKLIGEYGLDVEATVDYIKRLKQPFNLTQKPDQN